MRSSKIKPSYDSNRQILGKVFPLSTPFTVILDISELCNFHCQYCFRSDRDQSSWGYVSGQGLMEYETFETIAAQLMAFPEEIRQISLSNHGEPLMNRQLLKMVRHLRKLGYKGRVSIHTNASLLDSEYAAELGEAGLSRIVISLQGISEERYRSICGTAVNIEKLRSNIDKLFTVSRKASVKTEICVKIADAALLDGEEQRFYELFEDRSDRMFVEHIVPIWKNLDGSKTEAEAESRSKYGTVFPPQQCCRLIFDTLVILPNGDIYPCTQLQNTEKLGNIHAMSLLETWNSEHRNRLLKNILELHAPEMCRGCYIRQNSIYTKEDMIDPYRTEILQRLSGSLKNSVV